MGRYYWGRKEGGDAKGIVVVFAGMSTQEKQLNSYVQLYAAAGWNSLICFSEFLYMFFPGKAETLAVAVVGELQKELKVMPLPLVFAGFSGGPKSCMYKVIQIINGECEGQPHLDEHQLIRDCLSGHIYDSCPVDFVSESGTRFILHPRVLKMSEPPRILSWIARGFASGLDFLFLTRFEEQRAEYWQTLYSSVNAGPFLILCSEDDDLAPHQVICNFARHLQDLGGNVKLVKWKSSPHVAHYKHHPDEYKAAVTELLDKAALVHSQRMQQLNRVGLSSDSSVGTMPESEVKYPRAAGSSNERMQGVTIEQSDDFLLGSVEYHEGGDLGFMQDEQKERLIPVENLPSINVNSVLGGILFDVCFPKDVEDWEVGPADSFNRQILAPSQRHGLLNPIKCMLRSRL